MLFHQDKTKDELANPEENIKDGGMTLDRVAQIKKVIALMAYFLLSDH